MTYPKGLPINDHLFRRRAWKSVLGKLGIDYRKTYATRHTAISHALANGANHLAVAEADGCARVYPHELWRRNQYYYFFAYSSGKQRVWAGDNGFCVRRGSFKLYQTDYVRNNCSSVDGGRWEKFKRVDIGGGKVQNYTVNLE